MKSYLHAELFYFILYFYFYFCIFILFCILFFSLFFFFLLVVNFVIHWNETAMGLHVFPIPIPPPMNCFKWQKLKICGEVLLQYVFSVFYVTFIVKRSPCVRTPGFMVLKCSLWCSLAAVRCDWSITFYITRASFCILDCNL